MRHVVVVAVLLTSVARADDKPPTKPKGHLVDPWARMPHPRDGMKLPDPRKAAERATTDGVVSPVTPEPRDVAPEPAATAIPASATPTLAPAPTPLRTTTHAQVDPPPPAPHAGLTVEAAIGFGAIYVQDRNHLVHSPGGVGGLDLGIGGWIGETTALTLRVAGSSTATSEGVVVASWIGPSLQQWATDETWFGFGLGLASLGLDSTNDKEDFALGGAGVDLRLGHTIYAKGNHTLNGSIEVTPSSVQQDFGDGYRIKVGVASLGLLLGWQYL
jgi:hypothetical protein